MKFVTGFAWVGMDQYVPLARTAEEAGWDGIVLSDHLVHLETIETPYPYNETGERPWQAADPYPDVWVSTAAMAAVTERIHFFQGVYVVPLRDVFSLAKSIGTAAALSNGRVSLGLGLGWMKEEFALAGQPFARRAKRAEEMIDVMRKLWTGEMVEHHGEFYDFPPLLMSPPAGHPVPIYVGGKSEAALRRVARIGDGWIPDFLTISEFREGIDKIRKYQEEAGRAGAPLDVIGACSDAFDLDGYRRLADVGVTHLWSMPWMLYGGDTTSLGARQDALKRFGDEIIARW
ncbi:MAG: LLM class F420-dependent oxidoreductase [Myxococcota bacterium]